MIRILSILILCSLSTKAMAQGCSDAGFCTIGELKGESSDSTVQFKQKLSFGPTFGLGEDRVAILTPYVQYDRSFNQSLSIQLKLTANYASGRLGNSIGMGDLFLSGIYSTKQHRQNKWLFTLGTKIPLANGNALADGKSLPFTYQSSLGTVDLIGGITFKSKNLTISGAAQFPLATTNASNRNVSENGFLQSEWNADLVTLYPSTNQFIRSNDVLLKSGYMLRIKRKLSITPGLLAVYHLSNDKYNPVKSSNDWIELEHSNGLTLNLTLLASYTISPRLKCAVNFGTPLIVRQIRPDGLTRSFVFSPEISYTF